MNGFNFYVSELSAGLCTVDIVINEKKVHYLASYLGPNPLASLVEACAELMDDPSKYYIDWQDEPGTLHIELDLDKKDMLHMDLRNSETHEEWHEIVPFPDFVSAITSEAFSVLRQFGLWGYRKAWASGADFPLTSLIRIASQKDSPFPRNHYSPTFPSELQTLLSHLPTP